MSSRAPVVLPITTGSGFARHRGFAVSLDRAGTHTVGVIRCDQPRALDLKVRNGTRIESVPEAVTDDALARLAFYDFPAAHSMHLRTTNMIESAFATIRHWHCKQLLDAHPGHSAGTARRVARPHRGPRIGVRGD